MTTRYRVEARWGTTGDCDPEHIYGQSEPPYYDTRAEADAARLALLHGARVIAPHVDLIIIEED